MSKSLNPIPHLPGVLLVLALALPAGCLGQKFPLVGAPIFGLLLGLCFAGWNKPPIFIAGIHFTTKKLLQLALILLGFEMSLSQVLNAGRQTLLIMLFTFSMVFITIWLVGTLLKVRGNTRILIGVGTAICGGSAIAATAPILEAEESEVAYALSTIFLFNMLAVFLFPLCAHWLGMSDTGFGLWAGTAINDTSSVVAAGYAYSHAAGNHATIVKLTRTLMIVPITLFLAFSLTRKRAAKPGYSFFSVFPWFILGFLAATLLSTSGFLPETAGQLLAKTGKFFIVMAMTAIGLNTSFQLLKRNGIRPILLGLAGWMAIALTSLAVQKGLQIW